MGSDHNIEKSHTCNHSYVIGRDPVQPPLLSVRPTELTVINTQTRLDRGKGLDLSESKDTNMIMQTTRRQNCQKE
eukprot:1147595-Pelagomonas_calceolata.AAC.9